MNTDLEDNIEKEDDIEKEEGNDDIKSEFPFDPNQININIIPRTIGQLVDMLEYDEILVAKFQRLPNLWNIKQKSRFIESLMLKLPIPLFYFAEQEDDNKNDKWLVIDGLQRISTLESFILGNKKKDKSISNNKEGFKLENLEFRTEFNGKRWDDLPKDIQRRINTNQVTINLIGKNTPEAVKYNIFSRINQGGIQLKPQEIRTALFQGYRNDFLASLVSEDTPQGKAFILATDGSVPIRRQENLDFVTRFVSFYLLGHEAYEPDMDTFMTQGTKAIPKNKKEQEKIADAFKKAMEVSHAIFEKNAFRKPIENDRRKPINKPLFEVISVSFSRLSDENLSVMREKKELFVYKYEKLFSENKKFLGAISTGTASKDRVKERHEAFENLINEFKK